MNVERRTKNVERGAVNRPRVSLVFPDVFMICRRAIGNACVGIGFARASGANPSSTFFVLR